MGRRAIFERVQQKSEALACLLFAKTQRRENLRLHVAAMNTDGARTKFGAIQDQIVRLGAAPRRVGGKLLEILVMHRSEGMMRRVPPAIFLVPFEHGKIDD